jgi:hypothetical protein
MTCDHVQELLVDRWMRGLSPTLEADLSQHLEGCAACRVECERLTTLWRGLGEIPIEEPSRQLREGFQHMLDAYRIGSGARSMAPAQRVPWWKTLWPSHPVAQFAVAGMALLFGLVSGHLYTARVHDQQTIAQMSAEMQNMRQLVALSLLQQQSASERLRGVNYSVRMQPADDEVLTALLETLKYDSNVNVRLAAVDALRQFSTRVPVRRGLRDALSHQDSPLVQIALIELARDTKDRGAVDALEQLRTKADLHPSVSTRLDRAIDILRQH